MPLVISDRLWSPLIALRKALSESGTETCANRCTHLEFIRHHVMLIMTLKFRSSMHARLPAAVKDQIGCRLFNVWLQES